jgi:DNA uptake protein ComE-like DNA-binding protein
MNGKIQRFERAQPRFLAMSAVMGMAFLGGMAFLSSCNGNSPSSDEHLQQQAAQATEDAKQQSKEALAEARVAAANAEQKVNDVAAGVKEGLHSNPAPADDTRVDLNNASDTDLASLPGITPSKAKQIIQHRPYAFSHELVKFGLVSEKEFDAIAARVTVR